MCAVFFVARAHSHVAFHSKYSHFCISSLLHVNHVRSQFRHLHVVHELSYLLARFRRECSRSHTTQEAVPGLHPFLFRVLPI